VQEEMVQVKPISDFSMDLFRVDGKAAIVTGASTGLGQAYAVALAKAGANLFLVDLNPADETRDLILKEGRKVTCLEADLTIREHIEKVVRNCVDAYGKIDILVNNAGTMKPEPVLEFSEANWKRTIDIHINTVFYLSQSVARIMVSQGRGKIINIGSLFSFQGAPGSAGYATAKTGVLGLTRDLAVELAAHNVQVNALCPGWILTASGIQMFGEDRKLAASIPAQRCGDPFDCMGSLIYLASGASDYITGVALPMDGGYLVSVF
jgi:2-dehydro-3-deoxy-D-gluconate 5-dehydrogenase